MADADDLGAIAERLYAQPPEQFTAARDEAAKQARTVGDRDLAAQVKEFRRPSIGAWLVNQVARSGDESLDELFDLGTSLRGARDAFDGVLMRTLSRQRPHVVRALTERARTIADDAGQHIGDQALREFEATWDAALADQDAADAVRTGRLMRPLTSTGLEAVDLGGAVAAPETPAPKSATQSATKPTTKPTTKPAEKATTQPTKKSTTRPTKKSTTGSSARRAGKADHAADHAAERAAERAADRAAQQRLTKARSHLDKTGKAVERRDQDLADARAEVETVRARIGEVEAELADLNTRRAAAEDARRAADGARRAAVREREAAQRALAAAQTRAERR